MLVRERTFIANVLTFATWYLFWYQPGVDRQGWQIWLIKHVFQNSILTMYIVVTLVVYVCSKLLPLIFYYTLYHLQIPYFEQWRIHDHWDWDVPRKRDASLALIQRTWKQFTENLIFECIALPLGLYMYLKNESDEELMAGIHISADWKRSAMLLLAATAMFETIFYWGHRAQHDIRSLYKHHKIHHEYKQTLAAAGSRGSHMDGLVSLVLPGLIPMLLLPFTFYDLWMWIIIHQFHTAVDHSGYDFPFCPFDVLPFSGYVRHHNFHHTHIMGNYGLYYDYWDRLMGTNRHYKAFAAKSIDKRIVEINELGDLTIEHPAEVALLKKQT